MKHPVWTISLGFLLFTECLMFGLAWGETVGLQNMEQISQSIREGQEYVKDFPLNDPNPRNLRKRFLELKNSSPLRITLLRKGLQGALWLEQTNRSTAEREQIADATGNALRLLLQGWNYAGNVALLDGLRVSYPNSSSSPPSEMTLVAPPSCSPQLVQNSIQINDLCMAQGFFEEGLRLLSNTLANRAPGQPPLLVTDVKPLPDERYRIDGTDDAGNKITTRVSGWFSNDKVPQYTHYDVTKVSNGKEQIEKVVPILTEGYQIGKILQKYHQTVQTIAQREWGAASFNKDMSDDDRSGLRDQAVRTLYMSAHHAFLADLAFAAQTSDQPGTNAQFPYREANLNAVREANESSREIIHRIRNGKKPILPIEDIVSDVVRIEDKIKEIKNGDGVGSIARAKESYNEAKVLLQEGKTAQVSKVNDNQVRKDMISRFESFTGITIPAEKDKSDIIIEVQQRISSGMEQEQKWKYSEFDNELDERLADFFRAELRRKSKLVMLEGIHERLKIINNRANTTKIIREQTSEQISKLHTALGILNQVPTFSFPSGVSYDHFAFAKEDIRKNIENARDREIQRIDEANTEELRQSLQIDIKEATSGIDELDFEVKQATRRLQQLLGTVENLLNRLYEFDDQIAQLWYNDPTVISAVSIQEERANQAQDILVGNLYRLGKMLEFRWHEPFSNPVKCRGKSELLNANGAYNNFFDLDSVFALGSVQVANKLSESPSILAEDFYDALEAWDKMLRDCRKSNSPLQSEVIVSLRQDIKGWRDIKQDFDGKWVEIDPNINDHIYRSNVERFHTWLHDNLTEKRYTKKDRLRLTFAMDQHSKRYTIKRRNNTLIQDQIIPVFDLNSWNYRVNMIQIKIKSISGQMPLGKTIEAIAHIAQDGIIYNYSAAERLSNNSRQSGDPAWYFNLENYVDYDPIDLSRSELGQYFLAQTNAFVDRFKESTGTLNWSPYCSKWILQIVSDEIDIDSIDDIELKIQYSYGVPKDVKWL